MSDLTLRTFAFTIALTFAPLLGAQTRLADIATGRYGNGTFSSSAGAVMQGVLYFGGSRWDIGHELWRSDGTAAGTYLVADLAAGTASGAPSGIVASNSRIWFGARGAVWCSDGTVAGTRVVSPGFGTGVFPGVVIGNRVVWIERVGGISRLLSHDGVSAAPDLLSTFLQSGQFVASGSRVYFAAEDATTGSELWHTDGTVAGTVVLDAAPGAASTLPREFAPDGSGGVWYVANDSRGWELWHSDGTLAGTGLAVDLTPGILSSDLRNLYAFGNRVLFAGRIGSGSGEELWISDGTPAGSTMVADLRPGSSGSEPNTFFHSPALQRVLFSANDGTNGREVWITDGTSAGTFSLGDLNPGSASSNSSLELRFVEYGQQVYFSALSAAFGRELHRTDGTVAGTVRVADIAFGQESSDATPLAEVAGKLLLAASVTSIGRELWQLTTTQTPTLLFDGDTGIPNGSMPTTVAPEVPRIATLDGAVHFVGTSAQFGAEPYTTRGTPATTALLTNLEPGASGHAQLLDATTTHVFYSVRQTFSTNNGRLVSVDRTGAVQTLHPTQVRYWATLDDQFVFAPWTSSAEPWITDGTPAGTRLLRDVMPGASSSGARHFARFGDEVWFLADDGVHGLEPWRTDGTSAGTVLALDLAPGPSSLGTFTFLPGRTRMFLVGHFSWLATDGTAAGTTGPQPMAWRDDRCVLGDVLIGTDGNQVWRTDGTVSGTHALMTLPLPGNTGAYGFVVARDRAFFILNHPTAYQQLWATDGTVGGTGAVVDMGQVPGTTVRTLQAAGLAHVAVPCVTFEHGNELWISDGTAGGTSRIADAAPGPAPSNPVFVTGDATAGGHYVWWATNDTHGQEPWAVPLAAFGGADRDVYGLGCAGTAGVPQIEGIGVPVIGAQTGFRLRRARANTFAYLAIGFTKAAAGPCALLTSGEVLVPLTTDATGRAAHTFPIPNATAFVSFELTAQFVCLDPLGSQGLASGSPGMHVVIGR